MTPERSDISSGHAWLLNGAAGAVFLLVTLGGTVCITGATLGCPDWPGCYGRVVPPLRADSIIEYSHRLLALIAAPLVVAAAVLGWRRTPSLRWISRPPLLAIAAFLAVSVFGAVAVLTGLPTYLAVLDLGLALLALALVGTAATVARARLAIPGIPDRLSLATPFARFSAGLMALVFLVLVMGIVVAEPKSIARCLGWPLYWGEHLAPTAATPLQAIRQVLSALATVGILGAMLWAGRAELPGMRLPARAAGSILIAEIALGAWLSVRQPTPVLLVAYVALAAGLWATVTAMTVHAALPQRSSPAATAVPGPRAEELVHAPAGD